MCVVELQLIAVEVPDDAESDTSETITASHRNSSNLRLA